MEPRFLPLRPRLDIRLHRPHPITLGPGPGPDQALRRAREAGLELTRRAEDRSPTPLEVVAVAVLGLLLDDPVTNDWTTTGRETATSTEISA